MKRKWDVARQAKLAKRAFWLYENSERVMQALSDLLNDTQHKDHNCGDKGCPVLAARRIVRQCPAKPRPLPAQNCSQEPKP